MFSKVTMSESEKQTVGQKVLTRVLEDLETKTSQKGYEKAEQILDEVRKIVSGKAPSTQKQMIRQCKKIMEMIGIRENYNEDAWNDLKDKMNKKEWSNNYQRFNFYVLKLLARATKSSWPWYLDPPEKPQDRDKWNPVVPKDTLERAIERKNMYDDVERFCLALATTYGIRQVEFRRMKKTWIDKKNNKLTVFTAKKNPKRSHVIPSEIREYVYNPSVFANLPRSRTGAANIFHSIFDPISKEIREPVKDGGDPWGWHSIRRRIVTDLGSLREENEDGEKVKVFDKEEIVDFMRWSELDTTMFSTYLQPDEELEEEDQLALDRNIFDKHPYIEKWV